MTTGTEPNATPSQVSICDSVHVRKPLAKKSTANQCKEHNVKSTFSELQFPRWQYGSIFIRRCLPNLGNTTKFRQNSKSRSCKVTDLGQVKSSQVAFNKKAMTIALHVHNVQTIHKSKYKNYETRNTMSIRYGVNWKHICYFLLIINSNCGRISCRFRDIDI